MSESGSKPNPFDQGEWVNLSPNGSDNGQCSVRRAQIESVTRKERSVRVALVSGSTQTVALATDLDAELLVEACLTPTQRMVEVQGPYGQEERVMVAVDTIKTAVRASDYGMRVYLWIENGGTHRDQFRRDFETEQQVMEFLKLCGAKVE